MVERFVLLGVMFLAACAPVHAAPGALSFAAIEQKNDAGYTGQQQYNALEPGLVVILDAEAAAANELWFSEAARAKLDLVDWRTQFVVAVFQGWQAGGGYGVTVTQVVWDGKGLLVAAEMQIPPAGAPAAVTSPYHLIAVRRPAGLHAEAPAELLIATPPAPPASP